MYCAFAGNRRSGEVWVQTRRRFGQEWPFWRSRLQKRGVLCILSALKDSFAGARNDKVDARIDKVGARNDKGAAEQTGGSCH